MIVIADSTPLHHLILIDQTDLLPVLFDRILIPPAVFEELQRHETPDPVRHWIADPPSWLQVQALGSTPDPTLDYLDPGERQAIALAEELRADQLLLDDADARREAARRRLPFIGTLGVLREAARREFLDLRPVLAELLETSFYVHPDLIESLLEEEARRKPRARCKSRRPVHRSETESGGRLVDGREKLPESARSRQLTNSQQMDTSGQSGSPVISRPVGFVISRSPVQVGSPAPK
jgi:predicted nucleic acid-binding protein